MTQIADLASGPYWKHMGIRAETDDDGNVSIVQEVTNNLLQFYGNVHGGVIAGLLDIAIAAAINQQLGPDKGAYTVEMNINYLRSVNKGTLRGRGSVIKMGKNLLVGQGLIQDEIGQSIAHATATFMVVPLKGAK